MTRLTRVATIALVAASLIGSIALPAVAEVEKAVIAIEGGMQCSL